jgi:hypothetical protein
MDKMRQRQPSQLAAAALLVVGTILHRNDVLVRER